MISYTTKGQCFNGNCSVICDLIMFKPYNNLKYVYCATRIVEPTYIPALIQRGKKNFTLQYFLSAPGDLVSVSLFCIHKIAKINMYEHAIIHAYMCINICVYVYPLMCGLKSSKIPYGGHMGDIMQYRFDRITLTKAQKVLTNF